MSPSVEAFFAEFHAMRERAEKAEAELAKARDQAASAPSETALARESRALDVVEALLKLATRGRAHSNDYLTHNEQAALRKAKALLVERGR